MVKKLSEGAILFSDISISDSGVDSGGAGGARGLSEFVGSEEGRSLISAYPSLAITASTSGFKKLSTALNRHVQYACGLFFTGHNCTCDALFVHLIVNF